MAITSSYPIVEPALSDTLVGTKFVENMTPTTNSFNIGELASLIAGTINISPITIGTANGLSLSGTVLSLGLSSASGTGALSAADWSTFNAKPNASDVVTLAGTQTITGTKTFNNTSSGNGIVSSNTSSGNGIYSYNSSDGTGILAGNNSTGEGINILNTGAGRGVYSQNTYTGTGIYSSNGSTGRGIFSWNTSSGTGIESLNNSTGKNLVLNNSTGATGMPFTVQKNSVDKLTINDNGEVTGNKFTKTGGTSSEYLMADGSATKPIFAQASYTTPYPPVPIVFNEINVWQPTGIVLTLFSPSPGFSLGTTDKCALKNISGSAKVVTVNIQITNNFSGDFYYPNFAIAINGNVVDDSTGAAVGVNYINITWTIELQNNDEVALYVRSQYASTSSIINRCTVHACQA